MAVKYAFGLLVSAVLMAGSALAGEEILRGPRPGWVPEVAPHVSNRPDDPSRHVRYERVERHVRAFGTHTETYVRIRARILTPLGLQAASQLGLEWDPAMQTPTVNHARIDRGTESIDILDGADFTILRREAGLERSLQINGVLTAVLINPDVRVGDTIDFAHTIRTEFDLFGNPLEALSYAYSPLPTDLAETTIGWPTSMNVETRAGRHAALPPLVTRGDVRTLVHRVTDSDGQTFPETISPRSLPDYAWQVSSIRRWGDIADRLRDPFEQASILPDAADLAAHVARIRSEHSTQEARAAAALRLVQDDVRYMAVALGQGGWLPVSASEVWASRRGDCKGKTVLLVALLRELGIEATPVLVSSTNLPLDKYLPMVSVFDHVVVRATIGGEAYLMDGARIGDRSVTPDVPLVHEHVLPLEEGARLESVQPRQPLRPTGAMHLTIDLSDGIYSPARVTLTDIDRGDAATQMQAGVAQVPTADVSRFFDERWTTFLQEFGQVSELTSRWEYRPDTHEFVAGATARLAFDWADGRVSIPLAHVQWEGMPLHEGEAFQDADYATSFPRWSSFRTTVIPPEGEDSLDFSVEPYDVEAGATRYFRTVEREGNRLETDRGSITLRPYATAAEIRVEQAAMDRFKDLRATMAAVRGYAMTAADRETLTTAPEGSPEVALRRGYALFREGDFAGAVGQFDVAIAGFATPNANALANRALAHLAQNNVDAGRADIAAAEAADANDVIMLHAKGRLAEIEGDDLEAVLAFSGALRLRPENTHALYRRAAAYERMGQSARALADLEQIAALEPESNAVRVALAEQLLGMGRAEQAVEQAERLAQSIGDAQATSPIFISLAQSAAVRLSASDPAKAEAVLSAALTVEGEAPGLLIDRAAIREMRGNAQGAIDDRERFSQLTGVRLDDPAEACRSQGVTPHSLPAALGLCDQAIQQDAVAAGLHRQRGYLLHLLRRQTDAIAAYRRAVELDPTDARAQYALGALMKADGQVADGEALMATALRLDPDAGADFDSVIEVSVSD